MLLLGLRPEATFTVFCPGSGWQTCAAFRDISVDHSVDHLCPQTHLKTTELTILKIVTPLTTTDSRVLLPTRVATAVHGLHIYLAQVLQLDVLPDTTLDSAGGSAFHPGDIDRPQSKSSATKYTEDFTKYDRRVFHWLFLLKCDL